MRLHQLVAFICLFVGASSTFAAEAESTDVFMLRQFIELQKEVSGLRQDIAELKQIISAQGARPVAQAPAPQPAVPEQNVLYEVDLEQGDPILGNTSADIVVVEFSDFECPFCSRFHNQTFSQLKSNFIDKGQIQYAVRDYPLAFHQNAKSAHVAANCAGQQDKYWKMKNELFTNQTRLGPALYSELSEKLSLKKKAFDRCQNDPEQLAKVENDIQYATTVGVSGTPTFFVGRLKDGKVVEATKIVGAVPFQSFQTTINYLLQGS